MMFERTGKSKKQGIETAIDTEQKPSRLGKKVKLIERRPFLSEQCDDWPHFVEAKEAPSFRLKDSRADGQYCSSRDKIFQGVC